MSNAMKTFTGIAATAVVLVGGAFANAAPVSTIYDEEVRSCVEQMGEHANYDDATRVRHNIVLLEESRLRYKFTIGTSVFTDSDDTAARKYKALCVVYGGGTPLKFRFSSETA